MSETIAEGTTGTAPPEDAKARYVCTEPGCGEVFISAANLGSHRWHKHGIRGTSGHRAKTKRSSGGTPRPRSDSSRIKAGLTDAARGFALVPIGLRNPVALTNPLVLDAVGNHADSFATAWTAVAEIDPRVKKWLLAAMQGSVWANAAGASLGFAYTIAVFSGFAPLHPAIALVPGMGDLTPFIQTAQTQQSAPTVSTGNGNGGEPQ